MDKPRCKYVCFYLIVFFVVYIILVLGSHIVMHIMHAAYRDAHHACDPRDRTTRSVELFHQSLAKEKHETTMI